ncbi:hypothetical protein AU255_18095 [Methyloprofundus sedimenti]|uniref:Sulfotransferase domain-containing protein n=1 Tax=Methyloprofundus sedimenti TaxID=1420851 RepID=A0A1V8M1I1_9GAMM|nr:hypothetical protein [Methyloprofundus sedimenti]OQK15382.1 hypothetical protein AU255_18095 [Methyloprofundus sedimenti]
MTLSSEAQKVFRETRKLYRFSLNPENIFGSSKYIFMFSHMRSRSSVLSHVLGSNPDICGHSELHLPYKGRMSLWKMQIELFNDLKCSLKDKYLFDKILHDFEFSEQVLEISKAKIIFLLRDPESTIKSIMNMGYITGIEWYKDPLQATNYYCSRLQQLEDLAQQTGGNYFFIESAELIDNTDYILEKLTQWLNLSEALDKRYSVFHNTGKTGRRGGDPSDNIKSGVLKKTPGYPDIQIPPDVLHTAESAYEQCRLSLLSKLLK